MSRWLLGGLGATGLRALPACALLVLAFSGSALGQPSASPDAAVATRRMPSDAVVVTGAVREPLRLDRAALQARPAVTLTVGSVTYRGADLWSLLADQAQLVLDAKRHNPGVAMYALVKGTDGYAALLSLAEMDPTIGARKVILAWEADGKPLGPSGVARLVVAGDAKPARSVAAVASVEVRAAP